MMKDGAAAVDGNFALFPIRSDHVLAQHAVEVDAELSDTTLK